MRYRTSHHLSPSRVRRRERRSLRQLWFWANISCAVYSILLLFRVVALVLDVLPMLTDAERLTAPDVDGLSGPARHSEVRLTNAARVQRRPGRT